MARSHLPRRWPPPRSKPQVRAALRRRCQTPSGQRKLRATSHGAANRQRKGTV
ncbi:hypothetical protein KPATCC21470_3863 [Kitasatospora purpeofusca]